MPSAYLSEFSEVKKAWEKKPQQFTAINSVFLTMIHFLIFWMFYLLFIPNVYCLLLLIMYLCCWAAVLAGMANSECGTPTREFTN